MPSILLISILGGLHTGHLVCHSRNHDQTVANLTLPNFQGIFGVISRQTLELMGSIEMMIVHSP